MLSNFLLYIFLVIFILYALGIIIYTDKRYHFNNNIMHWIFRFVDSLNFSVSPLVLCYRYFLVCFVACVISISPSLKGNNKHVIYDAIHFIKILSFVVLELMYNALLCYFYAFSIY